MTEGNRERIREVSDTLVMLTSGKEDMEAQSIALKLLDLQQKLIVVIQDLVWRPEVNNRKK